MTKNRRSKGSLAQRFPRVAAEWSVAENGGLRACDVLPSCRLRYVWRCRPFGHRWVASVNNRTSQRATGCPVCANRLVLAGFNDLATTHPSLVEEWDYEVNGCGPDEVITGCKKKFGWSCRKWGHKWTATAASRVHSGVGCPVCANMKVLAGFNDLATVYPAVASTWDARANGCSASEVLFGSAKIAHWTCSPHGHTWRARISERVRGKEGLGCPVCANRVVWQGYNDLLTLYPELARELDVAATGCGPEALLAMTTRKVSWICERAGHKWKASPNARTTLWSGCPQCAKEAGHGTSLAEQALRRELATYFDGVRLGEGILPATSSGRGEWRCDIVIDEPSGSVTVVEFDGARFHSDDPEGIDLRKSADLRAQGFKLVRVRVQPLATLHDDDVSITASQGHHRQMVTTGRIVRDKLIEMGLHPRQEARSVPA